MISFQSKPSLPVHKLGLSFLTFLHFARLILLLQVLCRDLRTPQVWRHLCNPDARNIHHFLCRGVQVQVDPNDRGLAECVGASGWPCYTSSEGHPFGQESLLLMGTDLHLCFQTDFLVCKTVSVPRKLHVAAAEIPRV